MKPDNPLISQREKEGGMSGGFRIGNVTQAAKSEFQDLFYDALAGTWGVPSTGIATQPPTTPEAATDLRSPIEGHSTGDEG